MMRSLLLPAILLALLLLPGAAAAQQGVSAECGIADEFIYPVPNTVRLSGDDFAQFRIRFGGLLHTGVDLAFGHYGDPVQAIARGRVTYADPAGWDTEKGVVIVEHILPNNDVVYSVYGHMEPLFDYFFPAVGQCVEPGTVVGAIGRPTLSAPHLHLEVRTFGAYDGGPGHWDGNPLEVGWLHPLDFIQLWQTRLAVEGYVNHISTLNPPNVPPLFMPDGSIITASGALLESLNAQGLLQWRQELSNTILGITALPDGRILARTADDTIMVLNQGRYDAIWGTQRELEGEPYLVGSSVAFFTAENTLAAYTPEGQLAWETPVLGDQIGDILHDADGSRMAIGTRPASEATQPAWRILDAAGQMLYQVAPAEPAYAAFGPQQDYALLAGATLYHISAEYTPTPLATLPSTSGRNAALTVNPQGSIYLYPASGENTLYGYNAAGELLWESPLAGTHSQPPLLAADNCLLYALVGDGHLHVYHATSGDLLNSAQLYAGGAQPKARVLDILPDGRVRFSVGFLTIATWDGYALTGVDPATCSVTLVDTAQ